MKQATKGFVLVGALLMVRAGGASVAVTGVWARASAPGQTEAAIYLTLTSTETDRLVSVASKQAPRAMLHMSSTAGGMARMTDMDGLALPAGQPVQLQPRGMHVMLDGLAHGLVAGDRIALTLRFAHADPVTVQAPVLPIGAAGPPP